MCLRCHISIITAVVARKVRDNGIVHARDSAVLHYTDFGNLVTSVPVQCHIGWLINMLIRIHLDQGRWERWVAVVLVYPQQ